MEDFETPIFPSPPPPPPRPAFSAEQVHNFVTKATSMTGNLDKNYIKLTAAKCLAPSNEDRSATT